MSSNPIEELERRIDNDEPVDNEIILDCIKKYNQICATLEEEEKERISLLIQQQSKDLLEEGEAIIEDEYGRLNIQNIDVDGMLALNTRNLIDQFQGPKNSPKPPISTNSHHGLRTETPKDAPPQEIHQPYKIYFNDREKELSDKEFANLKNGNGVGIEVPNTNQLITYQFMIDDNNNPSAYLPELPQDEDDLVLTVMNIIENIVSHSSILIIETDDPLAAEIANVYVNKLKDSGLDIDYEPVRTHSRLSKNILQQIDWALNGVEEKPWFKAAQAHIESENKPSSPTNTR